MDTVFDSRRHDSRITRSRKGRTSFVVTARGTAQIVGSWYGTPVAGADDVQSFPVLADVLTSLGRLRHGLVGVKADDVLSITNMLYPDLPPVLGTDRIAWATITPARTGVRHDRHDDGSPDYGDWASADGCAVARHRTDLLAELPQHATIAGIKADDLADERAHRGQMKAWPTRYRLPARHGRRLGDPTDRHETLANGYCFIAREHLTSPTDDRETVFVGWQKVTRPTPRNGTTTAGKRTRQVVKRRTVEHVECATFAELLARFATVAPGERITWSVGTKSGAFTRAADGRSSATDETGPIVKSVRTLDAVRIKLERAAA